MPEFDQSRFGVNDLLDVSKAVNLASDRVAVERAYRLNDSYIAEKGQASSDRPDAA